MKTMTAGRCSMALRTACIVGSVVAALFASVVPVPVAGAGERLPKVHIERVPDGGIQPQALTDAAGVSHLLYFKGNGGHGDLFYVRRAASPAEWSKPIRVSHEPGSAIAIGTIRGGQMALGQNGRVHVAWNGSRNAKTHEGAPMLYTRLNDAGTAFEPERDLITVAAGLDGGGSVAADAQGHVYVAWHALIPGAASGEQNRAVFVARSMDDGRTFAPEKIASSKASGACGCCGMKAYADRAGAVYLMFRGASQTVNRPELLLVSRDGEHFQTAISHEWETSSCPMSNAFLTEASGRGVAAWETKGKVFIASIDARTLQASPPVSPTAGAKQRHPAMAVNQRGERLLVWTEGTGWQKGGVLAWQVFDAANQPSGAPARQDGVPVWSFGAAVAQRDGSFIIFY